MKMTRMDYGLTMIILEELKEKLSERGNGIVTASSFYLEGIFEKMRMIPDEPIIPFSEREGDQSIPIIPIIRFRMSADERQLKLKKPLPVLVYYSSGYARINGQDIPSDKWQTGIQHLKHAILNCVTSSEVLTERYPNNAQNIAKFMKEFII